MRGWICLLDPGCCLPLTMPDCFRIATDPLCVVGALGSFPLPPYSSCCARHTLRLRGLRATCHLTLRLPFRSLHRPMHPFLASRTCPCARPMHPFFAPAPPFVRSLSFQFLVLAVRSIPSQVLPALLFVCSATCPSAPPCLAHPAPSRLPPAFPTLPALYLSLIPLPRISSMALTLRPFPSRTSLPLVGFVCSGRMFYRPSTPNVMC